MYRFFLSFWQIIVFFIKKKSTPQLFIYFLENYILSIYRSNDRFHQKSWESDNLNFYPEDFFYYYSFFWQFQETKIITGQTIQIETEWA